MDSDKKTTARLIEKGVLDSGALELIPEIFAEDAQVHGPIYTIFLHPCRNHAEIEEHVVANRTGFPDLTHTIHGQLQDGNHVVTYFTVSGNNDGPFAGQPPTHRHMGGPGISVETFGEDGLIVDSWQTCDRTLNFTQLGALAPGLLPDYAVCREDARPAEPIGGDADPAVVAANKDTVARLYDAANAGDVDTMLALISPDAVIDMPGAEGTSREDFIAFVMKAREALAASQTAELLVGEGSLVAALVHFTGTHQGEYFDRPATGNAVDLEVFQTWRVEGGKVTALYGLPDWFSLAAQLGPVPTEDAVAAAAAAADGEQTPDHPNAAILRGAYAALAKGDIMSAYGVFAPDLVWHVPPGHRLAGVYEGRDTVFGMLGQLVAMTGGSLEMHVDHVLANDDRAVGLITSTATRNGKDFEAKEVHLFEMDRGKVKVFWTLPQVPFPAEYWAGAPIGDAAPALAGAGA